MDLASEKQEIIKWLNSIENPFVIEQIKNIKNKEGKDFDFEKEWKDGISIEEARNKTSDFIKTLPWKK